MSEQLNRIHRGENRRISPFGARKGRQEGRGTEKGVSWRVFNPDVEIGRQKIPIATDGTMSIARQASS